MNPQSSDAIRRLVSRSQTFGQPPGQHDRALTYRLTMSQAADRNWELQAIAGELPGVDLTTVVPRFSRLPMPPKDAHGCTRRRADREDFSYIVDPDGGFIYCDYGDRFHLEADKEQAIPLEPLAPVRATYEVAQGEPIDGRPTRVATVMISGPPPVRQRIWFIEDAGFTAFTQEVFAHMVGCPNRLSKAGYPAAELLALGLPVRLESYSAAFGNSSEPLTVTSVSDLQLGHPNAADFQIPHGYHNLRDTKGLSARLGGKGYASPQTMRLSDIRAGVPEAPMEQPMTVRSQDLSVAGQRAPSIPQCLPATFASQIAMETDQLFYDDVRFLINSICSRLSLFTGSSGTMLVNWLDQWAASPLVADQGDGLFCVMRDLPDPTAAPPDPGGEGLLDKLAERQARAAMVDGSIGSKVSMNPGLLFQVTNALSVNPPGARFDFLPPGSQAQLRDLFLEQRIGQFTLTYPTSTSPTTTFYGLIGMQLSDIEFTLHIDNTQPLTNLDCDNNAIRMHIALPSARADANIGRWPTGLYFAALGASGLVCFFVPFLCGLGTAIVFAGLFLLSDYAYVRVEIANLTCDATISFQPDSMQVLRPQVAVTLNGDVSVWYMSYIPTGLQQLASFVYSIVGSHTDIVMNAIESQLHDSLNSLFVDTLDLSFPPHFGPVPFTGLSSQTDGKLDDFLYLQAGLDAATVGISAPYITQVSTDVETPLLAGRALFPAAMDDMGRPSFRPYGGFAVSQDLINHYINSIWRNGAFNFTLTASQAKLVRAILVPLLGRRPLPELMMHLWPAVTPRTVLTPNAPNNYAATFFDDVRLCISTNENKSEVLELQFSAEAFTQVGLGAVDPTTNKLDIIRVTDTFLDLYFDLTRLRVKLINPEAEGIQVGGSLFAPLTVASLPALEPAMLTALTFALKSRDDQAIPSPTNNPLLQQYAIPGATIDFHIQPGRGNLLMWMGMSGVGDFNGLLSFFPGGAFDISSPAFTCQSGKLVRAKM